MKAVNVDNEEFYFLDTPIATFEILPKVVLNIEGKNFNVNTINFTIHNDNPAERQHINSSIGTVVTQVTKLLIKQEIFYMPQHFNE